MLFIILISLLSYNTAQSSLLSTTPPTIAITNPNSPEEKSLPLMYLSEKNENYTHLNKQALPNANKHQNIDFHQDDDYLVAPDNSKHYYSTDENANNPHRMKLKIVCGCGVIIVCVAGITALVNQYS